MTTSASRTMIWIGFVALVVLHHDFWFWDDSTLLFGFMPVGLAYHAVFSLAAAGLWAAAVKWAWPDELEKWADAADDDSTGGSHS